MISNDVWKFPPPAYVLECIEKWRGLDLRKLNDSDMDKQLTEFLNNLGVCLTSSINRYNKGRFWRIRDSLNFSREESISLSLLRDESDLWEPPKVVSEPPKEHSNEKKCPMGRCNAEGNPVLYVSEKLKTPFEEMDIKPGKCTYLIKFEQLQKLELMRIVPKEFVLTDLNGNALCDAEGMLSYQILREFIRSEFLKPVGQGTEYLHRISSSICRVWFNSDDSDGWYYPSVPSPCDYNIALKPESAHKKLKIKEVRIVKLVKKEEIIKSGKYDDSVLPFINGMSMVIESIYKGTVKPDGITWTPSSDLGGDF